MKKKYVLEIYRNGDAVPYVHGVAMEGVNRITFFKAGEAINKKDTEKKGLTALLEETGKFVENEPLEEYIIKLKVSEDKK